MPSSLYLPSNYRNGRDEGPITPTHAPGGLIRDHFIQRANAMKESRKQIMICQQMRRNLLTVGVPDEWTSDARLREVCEVVSPERQMLTLNMTNALGAREPVWTRKAYGGTDTDKRNAEESEVFLNGARKQMFNWEEAIGKGVEDGQYGFIAMPRPALIEKRPMYTMIDGKPNPRYDRDHKGHGPRDERYSGERSSRASIGAWKKDYKEQAAAHFPVVGRIVPALDCVPIFQRGWGRQTYHVRGLLVRSLMERDELTADGYSWKGMDSEHAMIPRGFQAGRSSGQDGQFYLYEMYQSHYTEYGECIPFVAYTVGGYETGNRRWSDDEDSAVINLKEEFGICRPTWSYFFGLHHADDDFDYRGMPLLWPVVRHIWNKEKLLSAYLAHTHDNAFQGLVGEIDPNIPDKAWMEGNQYKAFKKGKANEIVPFPGKIGTMPQATVGADARYMLEEFRLTIAQESDNAEQEGRDSGHAMVVGDQLLKTAKRQIPDGATACSEFAGEAVAELCCGLERGEWRASAGKGTEVYVFEDMERTLDSGEIRAVREAIRFRESWFGSNFSVTAKMPAEKNLAEVQQLQGLYEAGLAKFSEVRAALGDESPETSLVEIMAHRWLTTNPIGMLTVDIEVAHLRGMSDEAKRLEAVLAEQLNAAGFPNAALAPEFQGQPGAGGQALPPGVQLPDMGASVLGGAVAGQMGSAARQSDAAAQLAVAPGQGTAA